MITSLKQTLSLITVLLLGYSSYSDAYDDDFQLLVRGSSDTPSGSSRSKADSIPELEAASVFDPTPKRVRDNEMEPKLKAVDMSSKKKRREKPIVQRHDDDDNNNNSRNNVPSSSRSYSYAGNINPDYKERRLISCCQRGKVIALTFDDGPDEYTGQLLDYLQEEQVPATFFVLGEQLEHRENCGFARRAHNEGHLVASHTYDHSDLTHLGHSEIENQMERTASLIKKCTGSSITHKYMRPPLGAYNHDTIDQLTEMGYKIVMWNLDPEDWRGHVSASKIDSKLSDTDKYEPERRSKILLLHDIKSDTVDNIKGIIARLRSYGYSFVRLDECHS